MQDKLLHHDNMAETICINLILTYTTWLINVDFSSEILHKYRRLRNDMKR